MVQVPITVKFQFFEEDFASGLVVVTFHLFLVPLVQKKKKKENSPRHLPLPGQKRLVSLQPRGVERNHLRKFTCVATREPGPFTEDACAASTLS